MDDEDTPPKQIASEEGSFTNALGAFGEGGEDRSQDDYVFLSLFSTM